MDKQSRSPLTIAEAAEILNLKKHTLESMRWQGAGPPFRKHGGRIYCCHDDLKEWSENGRRGLAARNASPSVPIGLYRMAHGSPRRGELALVQLTGPMAVLADRRGYLPRSAYLLKPVAAVAGDRVCRFDTHVLVRGRLAALAFAKDNIERHMPPWHGCRTLQPGELFLLAKDPASFDSRYFGTVRTEHLAGRAVLLWSRR
jgi:conjugative transfer signal peptidase TraF